MATVAKVKDLQAAVNRKDEVLAADEVANDGEAAKGLKLEQHS